MRNLRLAISFLCFLFFAQQIDAQQRLNFFFRHITQADGLLHNQVLSITQDEKGFMWIATSNGLQRYDGTRFLYYPEMLSDPAEPHTTGATINADKKNGLIWISNDVNLEKLELRNGHFTVYGAGKGLKQLPFMYDSYPYKNGCLLLGSHAIYMYDSSSQKTALYQLNILSRNTNTSASIVTDSTGSDTWVAGYTSLLLLDKKSRKVYSNLYDHGAHPLLQPSVFINDHMNIRFVMKDSRQNIWVTTWGDLLYRYDNNTKKITRYSLSVIKTKEQGGKASAAGVLLNYMLEDDHHTIWVATQNAGLLKYNEACDNFDYCIVEEKKVGSIQYTFNILSLFQDKEENIWIATDKGISIFNPYRPSLTSIRHEEGNEASLSKSEINSFLQATNGDIFIGTWGEGLSLFDSSLNFKKHIFFNGPHENNLVWSMIQADENTIWIGCQHGYLTMYNIRTGSTKTLHPPEMEGNTILCMEKDNTGNVWFGLHNGKIAKWDKKASRFLPYGAGTGNSLIKGDVLNIFIDRAQHCWVSTTGGFKAFDIDKRVFTNVWVPGRNDAKSISAKLCQGIEECDDSVLLIGTVYGGIDLFNKNTKIFSHLSTEEGMPSNTAHAIKKDIDGNVWFTTDYNIYKFYPPGKKSIPYGMPAGVISSSFSATGFYPLRNGQWATYSLAEAVIFYPRGTVNRGSPLKVEITGVKLFDRPLLVDSLLYENKPLQLSYKENFITIEYAVLNFSDLPQINYYYRLDGVDKAWVDAKTKRSVNYTNLQPGEYIFEVKAKNEKEGEAVTTFKIIITPPFWETTWFRICCLVIAAAVIYIAVKRRVNNIRSEEKTKAALNRQMTEMEMKALRSQMNPHFIFNCINSIDALIQSNDKYRATVYLNKFAKLLRNILDSSKQNTVSLEKDLTTLKLYIELEQLRHEHKFTAEINATDILLEDDYKVPPLIIQPFVENAILHGIRYRKDNNGHISVTVSRVGGLLQYVIEDNGVGRAASGLSSQKEKISYGIDMSSNRVQLFNNEEKASVQITDIFHNGLPAGTKVEVSLKIQ